MANIEVKNLVIFWVQKNFTWGIALGRGRLIAPTSGRFFEMCFGECYTPTNCVALNAYSQSNKRILGSAIFSNLMDGSLGNPRKEKNQDSQLMWMLPGLLRHFQMCWNSWKAPLGPPDAFTGVKNSLDQGTSNRL